MDLSAARLWMLTGQRGAGKTTTCQSLAARARSQGWDVAGLLSPAIFEGGRKTGILVEDVRTGETRPLASAERKPSFDRQLGKWHFNCATLAWGNRVIEASVPCDLLIIDELGPLELIQQDGWQAAPEVLRKGGYRLALVVMRPELLGLAHKLFSDFETLTIERSGSIDQWVSSFILDK